MQQLSIHSKSESLTRGRTDCISNTNFRLAVIYLQFPIQVFFSATISHLSSF